MRGWWRPLTSSAPVESGVLGRTGKMVVAGGVGGAAMAWSRRLGVGHLVGARRRHAARWRRWPRRSGWPARPGGRACRRQPATARRARRGQGRDVPGEGVVGVGRVELVRAGPGRVDVLEPVGELVGDQVLIDARGRFGHPAEVRAPPGSMLPRAAAQHHGRLPAWPGSS